MNKTLWLLLILSTVSLPSMAQKKVNADSLRFMDSLFREAAKTEVYKPVPPVVTSGKTAQDAPSDAIILFNGKNLNAWFGDDSTKAPGWDLANGILTVNKKKGGLMTKAKFLDYQLHLEYRIPTNITGEGQMRGNSSIWLARTNADKFGFDEGYNIQILDSYNSSTYVNGQAGALYKQSIPLANACKRPGEWQYYDVIWKAPRFNEDGTLKTPGLVTLLHNGVLVLNNAEVKGKTLWIGEPYYKAHGATPMKLEMHLDPSEPISFRNIWLRKL